MKLSVILPIYKGEKTLARTLDSLADQTFTDFELIACIDGSTDGSEAILQSYSAKFKYVKILKNPKNLGLAATMNKLVAHASGTYIAVAEQDDFYYPERFELQLDFFDKNPGAGLVSGIADFWDGKKITARFPGILLRKKQYPKGKEMFLFNYRNQTKVVNSCMMFRKSIHIDNGLYFSKHYPNVPVDLAYFLRFSMVSEIYGIFDSLVLLDRRKERNSVTTFNQKKQYLASKELLRSFKYEYPEIVSLKDYKFAKTTLHLKWLKSYKWYRRFFMFLYYYFQNPFDKRWKKSVFKRLNLFFTNN